MEQITLYTEKLTPEQVIELANSYRDGTHTTERKDSLFWLNENLEYHRENGPAIVFFDNAMAWWYNCKPHRLDGPARIEGDGNTCWSIMGSHYTNDEIKRILHIRELLWPLTPSQQLILKLSLK